MVQYLNLVARYDILNHIVDYYTDQINFDPPWYLVTIIMCFDAPKSIQ